MEVEAMHPWPKFQEARRDRLVREIRQSPASYKDIFEAIQKGDLDAVKYFVEKRNVDVNSRAPGNSGTVLGTAAGAGQQNIVEYLVASGADVNAKDKFGYHSLLWALDKNVAGLELVKFLVSSGADVNATASSTRYTPLHWAAAHNKLDIVQYLLENNANINAETKDGNTPYTLARANGHTRLATYLTNDKKLRVTGDIFAAAASGNIGLVLHMVEQERVQPFAVKNKSGETPLHVAAANGKLQVVKYLLELSNSQVNGKNERGETPLIVACARGHLSVVRYLLEIKYANPESADKAGYTPLLVAARNGHVDVLRYLVENANVDTNARDVESANVLHVAARYNRMNAIKYLVDERRYPIYAKNGKGETALHVAARLGFADIVRYFVDEKGMEITVTANDGRNVLLEACESGNVNLLKYLVDEKNADLTIRDSNQNTALHIAVENDRLPLVRYLVDEKRLEALATNAANQNAMALAKALSREAIYRYFTIEKGMTERPSMAATASHTTTQKLTPAPSKVTPTPDTLAPTQTYIFDGELVDAATRDKLVREFLRNAGNLSTREESFTNNGSVTVNYYINGMRVDLATRNKIINDYKSEGEFTKFYVNGQEVDLKTRNEYLSNLTAGYGNQRSAPYAVPMKLEEANLNQNGAVFHVNGQIVDRDTYMKAVNRSGQRPTRARSDHFAQGGFTYRVNGMIVDEGAYTNAIRRNNFVHPVNVGFAEWESRGKRSDHLAPINALSRRPEERGGLLPVEAGQGSRHSSVSYSSQPSPQIDSLLTLIDIGARKVTGNRYKRSGRHESLLSPAELIESRIDYNAIEAIRDFETGANNE